MCWSKLKSNFKRNLISKQTHSIDVWIAFFADAGSFAFDWNFAFVLHQFSVSIFLLVSNIAQFQWNSMNQFKLIQSNRNGKCFLKNYLAFYFSILLDGSPIRLKFDGSRCDIVNAFELSNYHYFWSIRWFLCYYIWNTVNDFSSTGLLIIETFRIRNKIQYLKTMIDDDEGVPINIYCFPGNSSECIELYVCLIKMDHLSKLLHYSNTLLIFIYFDKYKSSIQFPDLIFTQAISNEMCKCLMQIYK